ncbi:DUF1819 family protein [Phaeodactylibacter xiamenensis]|jgi:hypothetical protein|uniref:Inner membrane protein n=1 Tax=Phaeodactylibacter xiamenensis TaxID=1524460 RepID=A0A098S7C4_9BACT|nr:DUF1819 family protein [Phaeodactylibacter xiamenensis]KGE87995.1 hypothetical protein IX84_11365 [Phaeodactylibacter xiamenensis]MCR9053665.1 DUF1819 family protein [bacterium]
MAASRPYRLSFSGAALQVEESIKIAQLYADLKDWEAVQAEVVGENALQKNQLKTTVRSFYEVRTRLKEMTPLQMERLAEGTFTEQQQLLWVAVCKVYPFIGAFALEVLLNKIQAFEYIVHESDYTEFLEAQTLKEPKLQQVSDSTYQKLRSRLYRMMEEAGIVNNREERVITPPVVTTYVAEALIDEDPKLLRYLLVSDRDIRQFINRIK